MRATGDAIVLTLDGNLDARSGQLLREAVAAASEAFGSASRLEVDVRGVESCTSEGVAVLASCAEFGARLPEGLRYMLGSGVPGQAAPAEA
ncbi:MAG: STAS domain-containing protein [Acidimicrobiia bacterium]|nr:STAS domain-containing protein [Acidimicrobiia bacterium]